MASKQENKIVGSGPGLGKEQAAEAVAEYWTPERMAAAIPVPMPSVPRGEAAAEAVKPTGKPGYAEPGHPKAESKAESAGRQEAGQAQPLVAGGKAGAKPLAHPYTPCGTVVFTQGTPTFSVSAVG